VSTRSWRLSRPGGARLPDECLCRPEGTGQKSPQATKVKTGTSYRGEGERIMKPPVSPLGGPSHASHRNKSSPKQLEKLLPATVTLSSVGYLILVMFCESGRSWSKLEDKAAESQCCVENLIRLVNLHSLWTTRLLM